MKDDGFIRGKIPMTKSEVRAVSLSKLELAEDSIVYDVGAGTGSVSVEAALTARRGHVYAFEEKEEGCGLIRENMTRFGVSNLTVVPGSAPETFAGLPAPDRVFLGGTGGRMTEILEQVRQRNPQARIVANVITLETMTALMAYLREHKLEAEVISVQVSKGETLGTYHRMKAQDPVFVVTWGSDPEKTGEGSGERKKTAVPRILIAAPASGSGKTLVTCGLLEIFKRRGLCCTAFKCGPDYIDPMFHRYVLGISGGNLDSFFLSPGQVKELFFRCSQGSGIVVIEGVMGYYDGLSADSDRVSSYEIAGITDTPVILVADGKGSSLSLAALVRGFLTYKKDSRIRGVILNRVSQTVADRLRPTLEELGIRYLGAISEWEDAKMESRHLGLTIPEEQEHLREKIAKIGRRMEQCLDIEGILELAGTAPDLGAGSGEGSGRGSEEDPGTRVFWNNGFSGIEGEKSEEQRPEKQRPERQRPEEQRLEDQKPGKIAVAMDEAFCFYYQENLELLRKAGWELACFSPLRDRQLPEGISGILLGGGYPEVYAKQLSDNHAMLEEIRSSAEKGIRLIAECGGFLYLHRTLAGTDGKTYPMAGVIGAEAFPRERLTRFGYISLKNPGTETEIFRGHEFHYWESTSPGSDWKAVKPDGRRSWDCMYVTDQLLAGFPHLYYPSNPGWILDFLRGKEPGSRARQAGGKKE